MSGDWVFALTDDGTVHALAGRPVGNADDNLALRRPATQSSTYVSGGNAEGESTGTPTAPGVTAR